MKIEGLSVVIPTYRRERVLLDTVYHLTAQELATDIVVVDQTPRHDVHVDSELQRLHDENAVRWIRVSRPSIPWAMNRGLLEARGDVVLFLDDDFLCAPDYLAVTEAAFAAHPDMVVATGTVVADGANAPGYTLEEGAALLADDRPPADPSAMTPHFNGYGCNMAFRMSVVRDHGIRVDERLPLYAWYEDIDVTRRLGAYGTIMRLAGARGVHLGSKSGRVKQLRLGYSQVVNPVYLARKGSFPWNHAIPSAARHCLANLVRSLKPEPWADRWGRFQGNMVGLWDLMRG